MLYIDTYTIYHLTRRVFVEIQEFLIVKRAVSSTNFCFLCSRATLIRIYNHNYSPTDCLTYIKKLYAAFLMSSRQMAGDEVPVQWRGGMNTTYRFGGSFKTAGWYSVYHAPNFKAVIGLSLFCLSVHNILMC